MPHSVALRNVSDVQSVAEVLSMPFSATTANERHGNYTVSTFHSGYNLGQDITQWDSHTTIDSMRTLWPTSPDGQYPFPLVDQESGTLHQFLDQSGASLATHSHYTHSELYIPDDSPPYQPLAPTSLALSPHPAPSRLLETGHRPHLILHRSPNRNATSSSRRRRAARVIEHNGLWVDEDELLKALSEPNGKFIVHQCRWDEGHSPCGLWITGDKSSINVHIQQWHAGGGSLGGGKSQADCRWSGCGKAMQKESIPRHIVAIHLNEVWECQGCGKELVRNDAYGRHATKSNSPACQTLGALISYSADAREIDARATLESGGRVRYASA